MSSKTALEMYENICAEIDEKVLDYSQDFFHNPPIQLLEPEDVQELCRKFYLKGFDDSFDMWQNTFNNLHKGE